MCLYQRRLGFSNELVNLFRASPKRLALFYHLKYQLSPDSPGLKPLCPTRWTMCSGSIDSILRNYNVLCEELTQIGENSCGESSTKAVGLLALMEMFSTYFGLKLSHLVFGAAEQLTTTLQYKNINAQVTSAVSAALTYLQRQGLDSAFDKFYETSFKGSEGLTQEPALPRQRKLERFENGAPESEAHPSAKEYFRQQYFTFLDLIISELKRRFDQPSFSILREIETLILGSCNGVGKEPSCTFREMYGGDLNMDNLVTVSNATRCCENCQYRSSPRSLQSDFDKYSL